MELCYVYLLTENKDIVITQAGNMRDYSFVIINYLSVCIYKPVPLFVGSMSGVINLRKRNTFHVSKHAGNGRD